MHFLGTINILTEIDGILQSTTLFLRENVKEKGIVPFRSCILHIIVKIEFAKLMLYGFMFLCLRVIQLHSKRDVNLSYIC